MEISRVKINLHCPSCKKNHDLAVDVYGGISDNEPLVKGASECSGKMITVCFSMKDGVAHNVSSYLEKLNVPEDVQMAICVDYLKEVITRKIGIRKELIDEKTRCVEPVLSRMIFYDFIKRRYPKLSLRGIASHIGFNPNHATIIHAQKDLERIKTNPTEKDKVLIYSELERELFGTKPSLQT